LCFFKHYSVNDFRINAFGIMCLTQFFKKIILRLFQTQIVISSLGD